MTSKSENAALNGKSNIIQPREHAVSRGALRRFYIGDVLGGVIWKAKGDPGMGWENVGGRAGKAEAMFSTVLKVC